RVIAQARFPQGPDEDGRTGRGRTASGTAPQAAPSGWTSHRSSAIPQGPDEDGPTGGARAASRSAPQGGRLADESSFKRDSPKGRMKTAVRAEPARPQERRRKRRHLAGRAIVQARFPQVPDQDGRTGRARTASRTAPQAAPWTVFRFPAYNPVGRG